MSAYAHSRLACALTSLLLLGASNINGPSSSWQIAPVNARSHRTSFPATISTPQCFPTQLTTFSTNTAGFSCAILSHCNMRFNHAQFSITAIKEYERQSGQCDEKINCAVFASNGVLPVPTHPTVSRTRFNCSTGRTRGPSTVDRPSVAMVDGEEDVGLLRTRDGCTAGHILDHQLHSTPHREADSRHKAGTAMKQVYCTVTFERS